MEHQMSQDLGRLEAVFTEALRLGEAERAAYLDERCGGDSELRRQVERLLSAHETAGGFLAAPAGMLHEKPGTQIGRYRLVELLGEGGFGVVFRAEQERPVHRKVALKIIKLGMDTRQVVARFEAERQALAMMDHPGIARVFDGGATDTGRPYFVMELVEGTPITDYCDANKLSIARRLELFIEVCRAVQHAHQKGIIHRDIKPSNVMVTMVDGRAVPKIIDFGVAKATGAKLTDQTMFTGVRQMIGTPTYMSPEQAELGSSDVDTRSDIYSLGVLLYELLTGTTPFDSKELIDAAYGEMQRMIREVEPPRPSTRLSTMHETLASVAAHRAIEPRRLNTLLRGELDWIVMKCLEKDRARRYASASTLCEDVQHYLADEPVRARPPTRRYRLWKFARRNKFAVLAIGAVAAALIVGSTLATIGLIRARREAARADRSAATANAVSQSLQQMLKAANPHADRGPQYTVRQMLDDFSSTMGKSLANEPEAEADVASAIGMAYYDLDERQKAEKHLARALELRRQVFGEKHVRYAQSLIDYSWAYGDNPPKREAIARDAVRIAREAHASDEVVINALRLLELALNNQQKHTEVEAVFNEAMAIAKRSPNKQFADIANMHHEMVYVKLYAGDPVAAERFARTALEMHLRRDPSTLTTGWGYHLLGMSLREQKRFAEALQADRQGLAVWQKALPPSHRNLIWLYGDMGLILIEAREASVLAEMFPHPDALGEVVSSFRKGALGPPAVPNVASQMAGLPAIYDALAAEYRKAGRSDLADAAKERGAALLRDLQGSDFDAPDLRQAMSMELIRGAIARRDHSAAMEFCRTAIKGTPGNVGPMNNLAWSLTTAERPEDRDAEVAMMLAARVNELAPDKGNWLNTLGVARYRCGDYAGAIRDLERSCALANDNSWNHFFLAMAHHQLGQTEQARKRFEQGLQWMDKNAPKDAELRRFRAEAAGLLGIAPTTQP